MTENRHSRAGGGLEKRLFGLLHNNLSCVQEVEFLAGLDSRLRGNGANNRSLTVVALIFYSSRIN